MIDSNLLCHIINFKGWDRMYGAFTIKVEFEAVVKEAGLDFDPKSWEE